MAEAKGGEKGIFDKANDWVNDMTDGWTGKVAFAMTAYKTMDYFLDDDAEIIDELKDKKEQLEAENDALRQALAGEGLSPEKAEEYRKNFIASEGLGELERDNYSSDTAFRDAQIVQYQGAVERKADRAGLDRAEVAQTGVESGSGIGNFIALALAVAAAYAAFKFFTGDDGELDKDKTEKAEKGETKTGQGFSITPTGLIRDTFNLGVASVGALWEKVTGDDEEEKPDGTTFKQALENQEKEKEQIKEAYKNGETFGNDSCATKPSDTPIVLSESKTSEENGIFDSLSSGEASKENKFGTDSDGNPSESKTSEENGIFDSLSSGEASKENKFGTDSDGFPYLSYEDAAEGKEFQELEARAEYAKEHGTTELSGIVQTDSFTGTQEELEAQQGKELPKDGEKAEVLTAIANKTEEDKNPSEMDKVHALIDQQKNEISSSPEVSSSPAPGGM